MLTYAVIGAFLGSLALLSPTPVSTTTERPSVPIVVEVTLQAVAPGRNSAPTGEEQVRIFTSRTFLSSFVFHIKGEASGFPQATSANYACSVFDSSHSLVGSGKAHANFNPEGTSYPATDDIVPVEADYGSANAAGNTWTCSLTVVDKAGHALPVDAARSIVTAGGTIPVAP